MTTITQNNHLDQLTLKEFVKKSRVVQLIQNVNVLPEQKKQLKSYLKRMSDDFCYVEYLKKMDNNGRRYADKSLSLQNFKKEIRQSLVYDTHTDVDIKNCHIVIIEQYLKKHNYPCSSITELVQNRDSKIKEIMDKCKCTRSIAKDMLLSIMYLGQANDSVTGYGLETPPQWVYDLQKTFVEIADFVVSKEEALYSKVKSARNKEEYKNKKASCMSYVCQIIEDNIIMNAMKKLNEMNYIVDTLCFDGLLIQKKDISNEQLENLNAYCFEKTGYSVQFEIKEMNNFYGITDEEVVYDFSDYKFEHLDFYNQEYCSNLVGSVDNETYQLRKTYIEYFLCKVQVPDACYIFQNGDMKDGIVKSEPYVYSSQSISCLLKPIMSGIVSSHGVPINFYDKWSCDPKQRVFRKYDFIPYNISKPAKTDIFNMFMGFNPKVYTKPQNDNKCLNVWFDLCESLCGDDKEHVKYLHNFLANMFQEPTKRPPVAIVFKGNQGTGKNLMLDAIGNMIGNEHYITSSKPQDFFGDYAEGFYRKLLVNVNEAEGKDTFDFEGKMKSFITEDTIVVNPKFVRPTNVCNFARLIITTNKPNPIPIDVKSKDRRYVVYQTTDRFKNKYNAKTWTKMYNHFRTEEFMSTLYKYYMSLDLSKVDWINDRPITKAYRDMCSLYSPTEALFLEDYIDFAKHGQKVNGDTPIRIKASDLFTAYETFCKEHRFFKENQSINSRAFKGRLQSLELPMTELKVHHAVHWEFNPKIVYDYMCVKKWINDYGLDTEEIDDKEEMDDSMFEF